MSVFIFVLLCIATTKHSVWWSRVMEDKRVTKIYNLCQGTMQHIFTAKQCLIMLLYFVF